MSDVEVSGTRTLKALDASFASVAGNAVFNGKDSNPKIPDAIKYGLDYSRLTGTVSSAERVERSSGLALETNVNTTLNGRIIAPARGEKGGAAREIPVHVTSTLRTVLEPR